MSGEFNIFKNLDEFKKTNLLAQINLEYSKNTNTNSQEADNDDFDTMLNNNSLKSPPKRQQKKELSCTPEKKKKNAKSRRSSSSKDGSVSPVMPLLENLINNVDEVPVSRRTRRSLGLAQKNATAPQPVKLDEQEDFELLYGTPSKGRGRARVRGGNKARGRGRGKNSGGKAQRQQNSSLEMTENLELTTSSNDVSEQEIETSASTSSIMDRFLQRGRQGRNNVMRARRNYIAEVAARATNVDCIDLISSPWPRVEGMIDLDSDNEETTRTTRSKKKTLEERPFTINSSKAGTSTATASLDISFDDENPEVNVKITWIGKPEAFKLRKYQKFSTVFKEFAKRENTDIDNLVFNINDRIILPDDTPDSIDYQVYQFIHGRVLKNRFNSPIAAASKKRDANKIKLKIQSDRWKRPLQIDIMKSDNFRILYIKCSEELQIGIEQLKLSFDGELLDLNDTPADLDFEGGEAIDLRIKN